MEATKLFVGVETEELIRLHNLLSGGYWLGVVRSALNFRTLFEREKIAKGVDPFSWSVISGRVRSKVTTAEAREFMAHLNP